jgi:hypothetical protein
MKGKSDDLAKNHPFSVEEAPPHLRFQVHCSP